MIKGIAYQKVDLTEQEFEFYQELVKQYTDENKKGSEYFEDLFETNDAGIITIIKPTKSIPWAILFFVQNLMINQQLRSNDERMSKLEKMIGEKHG